MTGAEEGEEEEVAPKASPPKPDASRTDSGDAGTQRYFRKWFWTSDYSRGVETIYKKIIQGCRENDEVLSMVDDKIKLELAFAKGLINFPTSHAPRPEGFGRDAGATLKQAYSSFLDEAKRQGNVHLAMARTLDEDVQLPLSSWTERHEPRVVDMYNIVKAKIKTHQKYEAEVKKSQQKYYAYCRQLEEAEAIPRASDADDSIEVATLVEKEDVSKEDIKEGSSDQKSAECDNSLSISPSSSSASNKDPVSYPNEQQLRPMTFEIGNATYAPEAMSKLLKDMLKNIPRSNHRRSVFFGVYDNVSTGSEIALWARRRFPNFNVQLAEKFGQGLIHYGFIKSLQVGNSRFVNSSSHYYQWQPIALDFSFTNESVIEVPKKKNGLGLDKEQTMRGDSDNEYDGDEEDLGTRTTRKVSGYISGLLALRAEKSPEELKKAVFEADLDYRFKILESNLVRSKLDILIREFYDRLELFESERLKVLKCYLRRYAIIIQTNIESSKLSNDRLLLYSEMINPQGDLQTMTEDYKAGTFAPKITTYQNFYDPAEMIQTFGVELAHSSFFVTSTLKYLKEHINTLQPWLENAELADIYALKSTQDNGKFCNPERAFSFYAPKVVTGCFKEYLLELPDSVISFTIYDLLRNIYVSTELDEAERLNRVCSALCQLPRTSVNVLDDIIKYFESICQGSDESISEISASIGPYLLRTRSITAASMSDKTSLKLTKDLINFRNRIFSAIYATLNTNSRHRAVSSSETSRRELIEARHRELLGQQASLSLYGDNAISSPIANESSPSSGTPKDINGLLPFSLSPSSGRSPTRTRSPRARIPSSGIPGSLVVTSPSPPERPVEASSRKLER